MIATTRLPHESAKAYTAFLVYVQLGDKRSLHSVGQKLGKSTTIVERWSSKWRWKERIGALQVTEHEQYLGGMAQAKLEKARELEALKMDVRNRAWDMYQQLMAKAEALLKLPIYRRVKSADGKIKKVPVNASYFSAAVRIALVAHPLGQFAADMPNPGVGLTGEGGKSLNEMPPVIHKVIATEDRARTRKRGDS